MATIEELLKAAKNADAAGDTEAARALVQHAQSMMQPTQTVPSVPANAGRNTLQGAELAALTPPRVDAPQSMPTAPRDEFLDTTKDAMAAPYAATKAFAGGLVDQSQSPSLRYLQANNVPGWLQGPAAAVGDLGGMTLNALGTGMAGAAGLISEAIPQSRTQERKLASDLLMGAQVAAPELAGVSSGARVGASASAKPLTALQSGKLAAKELGIEPSLAMRGRAGAMTAVGMEKVPGSAGIIAKDATRAVAEVESVFQRIKGSIGNAMSPDGAGAALQSGLRGFVKGFQEKSAQLYSQVDKTINADTRFRLAETEKAVAESKAMFAANPELAKMLGMNKWDAVVGEAAQNGIPWAAIKRFRTDVGEAIGGKGGGALGDEGLGQLKTLYGALTRDMEAAAKAAGPQAYSAWKRANGHYKAGATRIERNIDGLIGKDPQSGPSGERAFEAFTAMTKADRAASDVVRMRRIKSSMAPDDWNTVSASIVDRLGQATTGTQNAAGTAFSPGKFLTEWNKLSDEGKRLLLPEDARIELGKLAEVAELVKTGNAERNFSNTGTTSGWLALVFGAGADVGTTAAVVGVNALGAKALTSPAFLRAVTGAAKGSKAPITAMARGSGPYATDAQTILRLMAAETAGTPANTTQPPLRIAK